MVAKKKTVPKPVKLLEAFPDRQAFKAWLAKNHDRSAGIWLRLGKKGSAVKSPTYAEALDVALCFGWIDGQKGAIDADSWKQMFTPRGSRSMWSKINREHVARLIASGEMTAHGLQAVARAKENGQWDTAYDSPKTATVPADFQSALDDNREAKAFFATINANNRYAILWRIQNAKKPETRTRKIAELTEMLARNELLHPGVRKKT